jgi:hypothetical protein
MAELVTEILEVAKRSIKPKKKKKVVKYLDDTPSDNDN